MLSIQNQKMRSRTNKNSNCFYLKVMNHKVALKTLIIASHFTIMVKVSYSLDVTDKICVSVIDGALNSARTEAGENETDIPVVGAFGSFTAQYNNGLGLSFSVYGPAGECAEGTLRKSMLLIHSIIKKILYCLKKAWAISWW